MKIAMVFDGLGTGGIERVGVSYAKILLSMGHEIDIYNLRPECTEMEGIYPDECKIIRKKLPEWMLSDRYILIVKRWWWGKYIYPAIYLFTLICRYIYCGFSFPKNKYDIAIAFSGHFRDMSFITTGFIKADKKMVWLHGALMEYLVLASTFGDQYRRIKNLCVLSLANQTAALQSARYLEGLNINHIYNPIDTENKEINLAHVKEIEKEYGEFLVCVARFEADKDQKTVIRALAILKEKYGFNKKIVFLGGGSTLEECRELAKKLNVTELAVFEGNRNDVADYYTASKMLIHSSPSEGLPTVLLEAMKFGVPIVATHSMPGVEEILVGEKYGMQCNVGDENDMAEKIISLWNDDSKQKQYISKGYERLNDFSFDRITTKLGEIIDGLI